MRLVSIVSNSVGSRVLPLARTSGSRHGRESGRGRTWVRLGTGVITLGLVFGLTATAAGASDNAWFFGKVKSVADSSFVLTSQAGTATFEVVDGSSILKPGTIDADDIEVGDIVIANGQRNDDNQVEADTLEVWPANTVPVARTTPSGKTGFTPGGRKDGQEYVKGTVATIDDDDDTLTVATDHGTITVVLDEDTPIKGLVSGSISDVTVNSEVMVQATHQSDGSLHIDTAIVGVTWSQEAQSQPWNQTPRETQQDQNGQEQRGAQSSPWNPAGQWSQAPQGNQTQQWNGGPQQGAQGNQMQMQTHGPN